ncbi:hypothetical protein [Embleya sp. NPDC059259]|uniref:hypothetical protein n=1 Tax=unclassified Embleya TaxID=2699296 RepID=UPI0036A18CD1
MHDVGSARCCGVSRPGPYCETGVEEADDDALIGKLRARAWDPALRFDMAHMVEIFADVSCGPLFPPISPAEVELAESRIGSRLPGLLRRVYTEVAGDDALGR